MASGQGLVVSLPATLSHRMGEGRVRATSLCPAALSRQTMADLFVEGLAETEARYGGGVETSCLAGPFAAAGGGPP